MKKIILLSMAVVLVLGIAGGAYWWMSRPQVIKFSDDTTLTLLGVDYGTRHKPPGGRLPTAPSTPSGRNRLYVSRSFTTPTDTLVVWVQAKYDNSSNQPNQPTYGFLTSQYHSFQFYVYDKAGTACGQAFGSTINGNQRGNEVLTVQFAAFPRRQGKLVLRVQEQGGSGQEIADGKFFISNPAARKSYAKWTPEPMPDTQSDGDLAVTLTKLVSGADTPYQRNQDDPDDAMNKGVQAVFHIERNGKPVSNWTPASVETTDATGNRTAMNYGPNGGNQVKWNGDEGTFTYQYGLWPDESAWKVRLEMMQTSDFSSDDEWTATNIPVVLGSQQSFNGMAGMRGGFGVRGGAPAVITPPAAPTPCAEADLGGHHIKIFSAVQFTNNMQFANMPANYQPPQQTEFMIQIQPALIMNNGMRPMNGPNGTQPADDGMRLTLAKVTDGQGGEIQSNSSGWSSTGMAGADSTSTLRFMLRDIAGVTNINATIAMHKNRFFEFTVKPEKAPAAAASDQ